VPQIGKVGGFPMFSVRGLLYGTLAPFPPKVCWADFPQPGTFPATFFCDPQNHLWSLDGNVFILDYRWTSTLPHPTPPAQF